MKCVNRAMLLGNVGQSPEIRVTPSGSKVAKFSLATNRTWKDKAGTQQEETDWHRLTCFGKLADVVEQWVNKGDRLYVEGRIEYSQTEHEGTTRYYTDVIVSEMVMLGSSSPGVERSPVGDGSPVVEPGASPVTDPDDDLPY